MIRDATAEDAPAITAIYAPYVEATAISFETGVPAVGDMRRRIDGGLAWIVLERGGTICGYACAAPFHPRPAYAWSCELSIYVARDAHRSGVGSALLDALLDRVTDRGMVNAFALIALPNPASVGLFESRGFRPAGRYERVGYKLDAWHDVGVWQRQLCEATVPPPQL